MIRVRVLARGDVQGVGMRPTVARLARAHQLTGRIANHGDCVQLELQGPEPRVVAALDALRRAPPPLRIVSWDQSTLPVVPETAFVIVDSAAGRADGSALVPDLAPCADCIAELRDPTARRHQYAFTTCAACGPRASITSKAPFDRAHTSMAAFPPCDACVREYEDPDDRRFHAQTLSCPACGPRLVLRDPNGLIQPGDALEGAAAVLRAGGVLAVKGVGGFQLMVDATNEEAVATLRTRKRRPHKPLAVFVRDLASAARLAAIDEVEGAALTGPDAPIVLLRRRSDAHLAASVAPQMAHVGLMLPASALHVRLADALDRPLVCTSGNEAEAPLCVDLEEAISGLQTLVDAILDHDRAITRPVDDGVVRCISGAVRSLRRARGQVPRTLDADDGPTVLALGGHLKIAPALLRGTHLHLGAHIGELTTRRSRARLDDELARLLDGGRPDAIACDRHPAYTTTTLAARLGAVWGVPVVQVGHHHAHVGAILAEHRLTGPVLGLTWDGTGYGDDGTTWGGEALVVDAASARRVASLRPFPLPGSDTASREPLRALAGLLAVAQGAAPVLARWRDTREFHALTGFAALARDAEFSPPTSSMGRVFDALAAACGLGASATWEGQAATRLEDAVGDGARSPHVHQSAPHVSRILTDVDDEGILRGDVAPFVMAVWSAFLGGAPVDELAGVAHAALAGLALDMASHANVPDVALCGGCFQNVVLTTLTQCRLTQAGFRVHLAAQIPMNDGGLAAGQAVVARRLVANRLGR